MTAHNSSKFTVLSSVTDEDCTHRCLNCGASAGYQYEDYCGAHDPGCPILVTECGSCGALHESKL